MPPSTSAKGPPEPVFYVDENLGWRFIRTLREAGGLQVRSAAEEYRGALDVVWIPAVANSGWIIVTKDQFRNDPAARISLLRHGAKAVVLIGLATDQDFATLFLRRIKWIRHQIARRGEGFLAKVYFGGRATVLPLATLDSRLARRRGDP